MVYKSMKLEHIAMNIPDPINAAAWYEKNLGMNVIRKVDSPGNIHFIADENGRTVLEFYNDAKADSVDYWSMNPFTLHLAFLAEDVEAKAQELIAAGAKPEGDMNVTPAGDKLLFVRDPWGVTLQLVQRKVALQ